MINLETKDGNRRKAGHDVHVLSRNRFIGKCVSYCVLSSKLLESRRNSLNRKFHSCKFATQSGVAVNQKKEPSLWYGRADKITLLDDSDND